MFESLINFVRETFGKEFLLRFLKKAETWLLEELIVALEALVQGRRGDTLAA